MNILNKKEIQHWINCWSKLKGPRGESVVNIWKKTLRTYNFMNNEKMNQIIDEVYEKYLRYTITGIQCGFDKIKGYLDGCLVDYDGYYEHFTNSYFAYGYRTHEKESFINKCKTDSEFSKKWKLKIEERDLTYTERYKLWFENNYETGLEYDKNKIPDFNNQYYKPTPAKLITITYNNETIESYE